MKPRKVKALAHYGKSNLTEDTLRACSKLCVTKEVSCPKQNSDCRHWINYEQLTTRQTTALEKLPIA